MVRAQGSRRGQERRTWSDRTCTFLPLAAYLLVWFALCSRWFERELLIQSAILSLAYLVSQWFGIVRCHHVLLSADGVQTLILVPAAIAATWATHSIHDLAVLEAARALIWVPIAFFVGHVVAIGFSALLCTVLGEE